jgi:hypothetical protein
MSWHVLGLLLFAACNDAHILHAHAPLRAHDVLPAYYTWCWQLFIAAPSFKFARPAKTHLPVIIGPGAYRELQFHPIEFH